MKIIWGELMSIPRILAMICILASSLVLSGCSGSTQVYTAPPEELSLQDAGKINLKMVDMGKLKKTVINDVSGVSLDRYGEGYNIQYRYLNKNITVKIIKFYSPSKGEAFWSKWVKNGRYRTTSQNGASIVSLQTKLYSIEAWQKDSWMTYIAVPADISKHRELCEEIREYINYLYQEL